MNNGRQDFFFRNSAFSPSKKHYEDTSYFMIRPTEYLSLFFRHFLVNAFYPSINDPRIFSRSGVPTPGVARTFLCERAPVSRRIFLKTVYIDTIPAWSRAKLSESSAAGGHFSKLPVPRCINNQRLRAVRERR